MPLSRAHTSDPRQVEQGYVLAARMHDHGWTDLAEVSDEQENRQLAQQHGSLQKGLERMNPPLPSRPSEPQGPLDRFQLPKRPLASPVEKHQRKTAVGQELYLVYFYHLLLYPTLLSCGANQSLQVGN